MTTKNAGEHGSSNFTNSAWSKFQPTVDGRHPANQLICKTSHYFQGFYTSKVVCRISEPTAAWPPHSFGDQDVLAFFAQHDVVDRISDVQKAG